MPKREHLVLCGGLARPKSDGAHILQLSLHGPEQNVRLQIQDISRRLVSNIPDELVDLLEVASYVYAADSAIPRGGKTDAQLGARWRRNLRFVIPVRRPELWRSAPVSSALTDMLSFLSEDYYAFEFRPLGERLAQQSYLEFSGEEVETFAPDEVMMFSGGLDSFAGAVEALVAHGKSIALVSHSSSSKIASIQTYLVSQMRARLGAASIIHVPVRATLDESLDQEFDSSDALLSVRGPWGCNGTPVRSQPH